MTNKEGEQLLPIIWADNVGKLFKRQILYNGKMLGNKCGRCNKG
jgi:hypothetical protein